MKLADAPVPIRVKLSALWASVMFLYIYGDYFDLYKPGKLASMLAGRTPVGPTTQGMLVVFAVMMTIPSVMVFLSLVLKPAFARVTNIAFGILYSLIIVGTMLGAWTFTMVLGVVEIVLTLAVAWTAWKWPREATERSGS
jgi:hypothetical protein